MLYQYSPSKLVDKYEDDKYMKKHFGKYIAQGMSMFLNAIRNATCAFDIFSTPMFYMEHLKGNLNAYYSITLDKKKSKYRLLIQMLDESGRVVTPTSDERSFLKSIKQICIRELSEHYEEY